MNKKDWMQVCKT